MNVGDSRRLTAWLSGIASFLFVAGCAGSAGSPPMQSPVMGTVLNRTANGTLDSGRKLYVSTVDGGSVVVYSLAGAPTILQTITDGVPRPNGIWLDHHGVLYAVNVPGGSYQTSLPEYKNGANSPFRTLTDGIVNCSEVAVDRKGNVYVTGLNTANGKLFLEIYPKGGSAPTETLTIPSTGISEVAGLAFDATGALLVGETTEEGSNGAVFRLPQGSQTFTNLGLIDAPGGIITFDATGNLYVGGNAGIAVYAPDAIKASRHFIVTLGVAALAIDRGGELYVGSFESILEYAPHAKKPSASFEVPAHVGGIALSS